MSAAVRSPRRKAGVIKDPKKFKFNINSLYKRLLKSTKGTVHPRAAVYLEAVLEYVSAEMIELAGNVSRSHGGKTKFQITEEDVQAAIAADPELAQLIQAIDQKAP